MFVQVYIRIKAVVQVIRRTFVFFILIKEKRESIIRFFLVTGVALMNNRLQQ